MKRFWGGGVNIARRVFFDQFIRSAFKSRRFDINQNTLSVARFILRIIECCEIRFANVHIGEIYLVYRARATIKYAYVISRIGFFFFSSFIQQSIIYKSVLSWRRISLTLSCPMNLKLYPLDRQVCSLRMASCK